MLDNGCQPFGLERCSGEPLDWENVVIRGAQVAENVAPYLEVFSET